MTAGTLNLGIAMETLSNHTLTLLLARCASRSSISAIEISDHALADTK